MKCLSKSETEKNFHLLNYYIQKKDKALSSRLPWNANEFWCRHYLSSSRDPPTADVGIRICRCRTIPMSQSFFMNYDYPVHRNISGCAPQPCRAPSLWDNYQQDPSEQKTRGGPQSFVTKNSFPALSFSLQSNYAFSFLFYFPLMDSKFSLNPFSNICISYIHFPWLLPTITHNVLLFSFTCSFFLCLILL